MIELKKQSGKSKMIYITHDMQKQIKEAKLRMQDIIDDENVPDNYRTAAVNILQLEPYEQNFILGFYAIADGKVSKLAEMFDISVPVASIHIKQIKQKIRSSIMSR